MRRAGLLAAIAAATLGSVVHTGRHAGGRVASYRSAAQARYRRHANRRRKLALQSKRRNRRQS